MLVSHYTVAYENQREYYKNKNEALRAYRERRAQVRAKLLKGASLYVKEVKTDKTEGRLLLLASIFNK